MEEGLKGKLVQLERHYTFNLQRVDDPDLMAKIALEGFENFVAAALDGWNVPGLALAIVSDSQVILAQGFGLRDRERRLPVTTQTLFAVASNTKAFTTFAWVHSSMRGSSIGRSPCVSIYPSFAWTIPSLQRSLLPVT